MRKTSLFLLSSAFLALVSVHPALADDNWRWHGDIHHFHEHDYEHWREGHWFHGPHEGREGWWWTVGGGWYSYPAPVYPYPDPYTPPMVVVNPVPVTPMTVPPTYTYYCANPSGFYPYVTQCRTIWQKIISENNTVQAMVPVQVVPQVQQAVPVTDDQRVKDDRQLNTFAAEFEGIDTHQWYVADKFKDLEKRVEAFRQSLFQRDYNAMDILKDAEDLKKRIAEKREQVEKQR